MGTNSTDGTESYRYERKFIVSQQLESHIESVLTHSRLGFRKLYDKRVVNNIYLDTPMFRFYNENVMGVSDRKKIRIRWYGDATVDGDCQLEIKRKDGMVGRKEIYHVFLKPSDLRKNNIIRQLDLPDRVKIEAQDIYPTLYNRYTRRYFISSDSKFRITIDSDVKYSHPNTLYYNHCFLGVSETNHILELKYDCKNDITASQAADIIPFSLAKKSKYVSGIESIYIF
ncbi:polyphosphate polymerase domain-containing protein [Desulfovibrio sp. UCD-KL4C]|uniref:polyphosphate polymerase domain-containing protein n=1 Tax=Desulfovibrio sp. UCD-KL4C TaxID=2578120 RepID=UPI0025C2062A|nr:polyphosphate polymerase domain-containing protein [Desulfovibrio sp. UCD-KL4C]